MCGIIGYVGHRQAVPLLLDGLARLEYRGYDSAGIVLAQDGALTGKKTQGRLHVLQQALEYRVYPATTGIGHTRWATHGAPSDVNSHPHYSRDRRFAVVHNGIIENHHELRTRLQGRGYRFMSETDTEVIVHLVDDLYRGDLLKALQAAVKKLRGAYAVLLISSLHPHEIVGVRRHSPLIVGVGEGENFFASDVPAILKETRRAVYLEEGETVRLTADGVELYRPDGRAKRPAIVTLDMSVEAAEKGGYTHFMLKEIEEQPHALENTFSGLLGARDVTFPDLGVAPAFLRRLPRIVISACGTAYHAGLAAKYAIEHCARIPVEVALASEFRYAEPILGKGDLLIAVTQSGETADTLASVLEAKRLGARVLAICNVLGSSIPRAADATLYTHAGPEIGVASTKAYTTQVALLSLLAIHLGVLRGTLDPRRAERLLREAARLPALVARITGNDQLIRDLAARYHDEDTSYMYIGRRFQLATAYEGALKLKEISYLHAEGYGAGEMKHGPIALVTNRMPVIALCPRGSVYAKMLSNIQEIRARGGVVVGVATAGDRTIDRSLDYRLSIPRTDEFWSPIPAVVPLQLLAYHVAVLRGLDPDKPRNLAKSVTVE